MPCYKGDTQIKSIYKGSTEIAKVYKGDVLVYTNNMIIYLGEGQTFDIASVYPDYANLTNDNFFILSASSTGNAVKSCAYNAPSGTCYIHARGGLEKKYTASTGKLICRLYATSECATVGGDSKVYANTKAVLVTKPNKLVKLTASSNSYNNPGYNQYILSSETYPDFASYAYNNFLIKNATDMVQPSAYENTIQFATHTSLHKNYSINANNGVLSAYIQISENVPLGSAERSLVYRVEPYLCKEGVVTS